MSLLIDLQISGVWIISTDTGKTTVSIFCVGRVEKKISGIGRTELTSIIYTKRFVFKPTKKWTAQQSSNGIKISYSKTRKRQQFHITLQLANMEEISKLYEVED